MTIVEALKIVLNKHPQGMTNKEAYDEIIKQNLYEFPAKNRKVLSAESLEDIAMDWTFRQQIQLSILKL